MHCLRWFNATRKRIGVSRKLATGCLNVSVSNRKSLTESEKGRRSECWVGGWRRLPGKLQRDFQIPHLQTTHLLQICYYTQGLASAALLFSLSPSGFLWLRPRPHVQRPHPALPLALRVYHRKLNASKVSLVARGGRPESAAAASQLWEEMRMQAGAFLWLTDQRLRHGPKVTV